MPEQHIAYLKLVVCDVILFGKKRENEPHRSFRLDLNFTGG